MGILIGGCERLQIADRDIHRALPLQIADHQEDFGEHTKIRDIK